MCQKCTFSGDTFYYPSIIFKVCSFEIFVTPTGKKKKKKLCRKQVTDKHRAVVRKISLDSESQWRLWEERKPQERMQRTLAWESEHWASETRLATCESHDPKPIMCPPALQVFVYLEELWDN